MVKNQARLEVRLGGRGSKQRRLPHVQPSEMIRVALERSFEIPAVDPARPNLVEVSIR